MQNNSINLPKVILVTSTALALSPFNISCAHAQANALKFQRFSVTKLKLTDHLALQSVGRSDHSEKSHGNSASDPNANSNSKVQTDAIPGNSHISATVQNDPAPPADVEPSSGNATGRTTDEAETIVVTGSHIRGSAAAGANVLTYDRQQIDQSGYASIHDFINTIPQNYPGGGGSEEITDGPLVASNFFGGSSVNLRGLGADSTLVLINGRRVAASGFEGNFSDVSLIPQAALERIEILPDGSSAIYGSDAVGGVINFILRKDFEGAETRLRYGARTQGSTDEYRLAQTVGHTWSGGHGLLSYEYYQRSALPYGDTDFAATRDLRPRGGVDRRLPYGGPGNILDPFTNLPAYGIPRNQDGRALAAEDLLPGQINMTDRNPNTWLLPKQKRHSVFATAEHSLADNLTLFGDFRFTHRHMERKDSPLLLTVVVPNTNPFLVDPFGVGFGVVNYSFESDFGLTVSRSRVRSLAIAGGARVNLSDWRWETYVNYGREESRLRYDQVNFQALEAALADSNPETAFNVFGDGAVNNPATINSILEEEKQVAKSIITEVNSVIDGPLPISDQYDISFAAGVNYRKDKFSNRANLFRSDKATREIYSAFAELLLPLIKEKTSEFLQSAEFSIAGRLDKYNDVGTTFNPKIGLRISPVKSLTFNATYGTSYRAPNLEELSDLFTRYMILPVPDPQSSSGASQILLLTGNSPETKSEESETWTVGATIEPAFLPGLRSRLDYFSTKFDDRIFMAITDPYLVLSQEDIFGNLITRNPGSDQLQQLCADEHFRGDPSLCTPNFIAAIIDMRQQNVAKSKVRGIDASINYSHQFSPIILNIGVSATYLIDTTFKFTSASPSNDLVDTLGNPPDFRSRANLALSGGGATVALYYNYVDSYKNTASTVQNTISSHSTFDLTFSISMDKNLNIRDDSPIRLNFNVLNLFDNDPPFVDNDYGYDGANTEPLGRFIAVEAVVKW